MEGDATLAVSLAPPLPTTHTRTRVVARARAFPMRKPTVLLRDRSPVQVSTMSPMPPRPSMVRGWAPRALAMVVISDRPVA